MSNKKRILLNGLKEADHLVFHSLLDLLSYKTKDEWEIVADGNYDVIIIDVDASKGKHLASVLETNGKQVIRFGVKQTHRENRLWISKPPRSADILNSLNLISLALIGENREKISPIKAKSKTETQIEDSRKANEQQARPRTDVQAPQESVGVRLNRWPNKTTLASFPGSSRLCAVLMRYTVPISQAAEMAGLPYDMAVKFVIECKRQGCIAERTLDFSAHSEIIKSQKNSGLFSRLRLKFGVRA